MKSTVPIEAALGAFMAADQHAMRDPYELWRRMREETPVLHFNGMAIISTHAETKAAYHNPDIFRSWCVGPDQERTTGALDLLSASDLEMYREVHAFVSRYMSNMNGEEHRRVRSVAQRAFTPKRIVELGLRAEQLTNELLDELSADDSADMMRLALRVPLLVIGDMLGASRDDSELLKRLGDGVLAHNMHPPLLPEAVHESHRSIQEFSDYVRGMIAKSRASGDQTDLVGALLDAEADDQISEEELIAQVVLFLFAGHETTTNLIGNGLLALLRNPEQWLLLKSDPTLVPTAVEEFLRYDAPVQAILRMCVEDTVVRGSTIAAGTPTLLLNGAANHDPDVFEDPGVLDITRRPNDHLTLAVGRHFCLGGPLARLEGRVVFETIVRRFPDLESAGDPFDVTWTSSPMLRGVTELPVRLGRDHGNDQTRASA